MMDFWEDVMKNGAKYEVAVWDKHHSNSVIMNGVTKARALACLIEYLHDSKRTRQFDWSTLRFYKRIPSRMNNRKGVIVGHFTGETARLERSIPTGGWDLH